MFADVQAADICDLHYTQSVRQPRFNVKVDAFVSYGVSIHERNEFQVDHLVPISLGGSNDPTNLWPQLYTPESGAAEKDLLERQLRGLVCSNVIPLPEAQGAIAANGGRRTRPTWPSDPARVRRAGVGGARDGRARRGGQRRSLHERRRGRLHRPQEHPPHVRDDEHGHVGMVEAFVMLARRLALIGLMLVCGIAASTHTASAVTDAPPPTVKFSRLDGTTTPLAFTVAVDVMGASSAKLHRRRRLHREVDQAPPRSTSASRRASTS